MERPRELTFAMKTASIHLPFALVDIEAQGGVPGRDMRAVLLFWGHFQYDIPVKVRGLQGLKARGDVVGFQTARRKAGPSRAEARSG